MTTSQAKIDANRRNAQLSSGPKTTEGKERSRRNGLKHGLTGSGIVVAEDDAAEIAQRAEDFARDLAPKSSLGQFLTRQLATLSVRIDRSAKQENLTIAHRTRHAVEEYDRERLAAVDRWLDTLGEDPRIILRQLRDIPEGVERLIEAWQGLRADLVREGRPLWTAWHRERVENLSGRRVEEAAGSDFADLTKAFWGEPTGVFDEETAQELVNRAAAKDRLIERIDREIADLEAHYETLDFETVELDRAEAPGRALFDSSNEAILARRYEAENTRKFFKTLDQIRKVEAEVADRPAAPATPPPHRPYVPVGSSWDRPSPAPANRIKDLESLIEMAEMAGLASVGGSVNPPLATRGSA